MATKNLGRTALEGGRTNYYKSTCRAIERSLRTANRGYAQQALWLEEDLPSAPVRRPFGKKGNQTDKLTPVRAFMSKQAGRPWAEVRAELFSRFDPKTLAGRHILFDHILKDVSEGGDHLAAVFADWYVDHDGVLRERTRPRYQRGNYSLTAPQREWLRSFVNRKVTLSQGVLFWARPVVRDSWQRCLSADIYLQAKGDTLTWVWRTRPAPSYEHHHYFRVYWRQGDLASIEDVTIFNSLPIRFRDFLLNRTVVI